MVDFDDSEVIGVLTHVCACTFTFMGMMCSPWWIIVLLVFALRVRSGGGQWILVILLDILHGCTGLIKLIIR